MLRQPVQIPARTRNATEHRDSDSLGHELKTGSNTCISEIKKTATDSCDSESCADNAMRVRHASEFSVVELQDSQDLDERLEVRIQRSW